MVNKNFWMENFELKTKEKPQVIETYRSLGRNFSQIPQMIEHSRHIAGLAAKE